jgi:putative aldouronate transport system permease protein
MAEKAVHGVKIKESRADRSFNIFNGILWFVVLNIVLYPLWLILIASVSDPDAVLGRAGADLAGGLLPDGL